MREVRWGRNTVAICTRLGVFIQSMDLEDFTRDFRLLLLLRQFHGDFIFSCTFSFFFFEFVAFTLKSKLFYFMLYFTATIGSACTASLLPIFRLSTICWLVPSRAVLFCLLRILCGFAKRECVCNMNIWRKSSATGDLRTVFGAFGDTKDGAVFTRLFFLIKYKNQFIFVRLVMKYPTKNRSILKKKFKSIFKSTSLFSLIFAS